MHSDRSLRTDDPQSSSAQASLVKLGEEILSIWEDRVREEVKSAATLLRPALRDALPRFLSLLGYALSEKTSRGLREEGSKLVREHAEERARGSGFGPSEIVQELQVLRETVTLHLEEEMDLSARDYETIQKTFDQAIQEALMEFFLVHAALREKFVATLSHDLRNPLSAAKMSAELILRRTSDITDKKARNDVVRLAEKVITNLKRADRMIQDLLDASILRIGEKLQIQITECDLQVMIREISDEIDESERSRIRITGNPIRGFWDCQGLRRAIENLLKNAFKYGAKETPITVQSTRTGGRVQISVHNYGDPIPEHERSVIFRVFGRSRSAQTGGHQGWGIGLSLVRAIAESLGGTATVESDRERGTTFTIDILEDARILEKADGQPH